MIPMSCSSRNFSRLMRDCGVRWKTGGNHRVNRCSSRCGLPLVASDVRNHRGSLTTNSQPVGSRFIVYRALVCTWSSTPRRSSLVNCACRRRRAYSTHKVEQQIGREITAPQIIAYASAEIFAVRPIAAYSSGVASRSWLTRKTDPLCAEKRFRSVRVIERSRPSSAARILQGALRFDRAAA